VLSGLPRPEPRAGLVPPRQGQLPRLVKMECPTETTYQVVSLVSLFGKPTTPALQTVQLADNSGPESLT
jgi:hypothetical protein